MKTLFITIMILLTANLSSNELTWVDEQVEAIKPPRVGMKGRELSILKDPFIFLKKNRTDETKNKSGAKRTRTASVPGRTTTSSNTKTIIKKKKRLSVTMLMNSSAFINGKWYKVGDKVSGYKVSKIDSSSV